MTYSQTKVQIATPVMTLDNASIANHSLHVPLMVMTCAKSVFRTMVMLRQQIVITRFSAIAVAVQIDFIVNVALIETGYFDEGICKRKNKLDNVECNSPGANGKPVL